MDDFKLRYNRDFFEKIVNRPEINLIDETQVKNYFEGKKILITGAGGTIGSALANRLAECKVEDVYFLDRDESALHNLSLRLKNSAASHTDKCLVADIKDSNGVDEIFSEVKPNVVFHAAALKHLIILERFSREGYLTNVVGTYNVLKASSKFGIGQFVNVSTDKAANPTSFLGKTKKITELITDGFNLLNPNMRCCSVRFGNVFASRGSVIETFLHQLKENLPVTLTDSKVKRYFMSSNEAANLILIAASFYSPGIYVQNMGEQVLLSEVISRLAQYLNTKFQIQNIGLQKGEKIKEDLYESECEDTLNPFVKREIITWSPSTHLLLIKIFESLIDTTVKSNLDSINLVENLLSLIAK